MVEKKEGAEMTCFECETILTCHEKKYPASEKFPEKVVMQWQNDNGTAHYSTKDGKNFTCNVPEGQTAETSNASTTNSTVAKFKRQHVTDEEEIVWNSILDKLIEYDILADAKLKSHSYFDSTNPAHNGQVKNFAFAVLQEMKKLQREESP